jgi:hypothetical protein
VSISHLSKTEVVRLSLPVLTWLMSQLKQGHKIMVEREEVVELNFPYLHVEQAKREAARA